MDIKLKVLLSIGLVMIATGLAMICFKDELAHLSQSKYSEVLQPTDTPRYSSETVTNLAIEYLKLQYYPDIENQIATTRAEYLGKGLWKVEFYTKQSPYTCPRQANIPSMIVYVNEQTNVVS